MAAAKITALAFRIEFLLQEVLHTAV